MKLTRSQVFYLTFMNYSILNLQILPLMIRIAGKDLWISVLLSSLVGLFVVILLWNLETKNPQQTWFEMMQLRRGAPILIWLVILSVILYLWLLCILTSTYLTEFINIGFLQETPFWIITILFGLSITYSLRKGITPLANLAGLFTLIATITGTTMSLALSGKRHVGYFLPVAEHGIHPILLGAVLFIPIWTELFFLGLIPKDFEKGQSWIKTYFWIVLANTIMFLGHSEGAITAFGLKQSENFNFPMLSAVKAISLGFIDRFDVYGLVLMLFGSFIRVSMYYQLTMLLVRQMFQNTKVRVSPVISLTISAIFLIIGTDWLFQDTAFFHGLLSPFINVSLAMFALFLFVYLYIRFTQPSRNKSLGKQQI